MEPNTKENDAILAYFCAGCDTYDIAQLLGLPECDVANKLPRLLERKRQVARDLLTSVERKVGVEPIARMVPRGNRRPNSAT